MSRRTRLFVAGGLVVVCVLGIVGLAAGGGSVRGYLDQTFSRDDAADLPGATTSSRTYRSSEPPGPTADRIAAAWRPADRIDDATGTYLRYASTILAILPAPDSGSYIAVDDIDRGYSRWYLFVGPRWGRRVGFGEGFRGGGPGFGK